MVEDEEGFLYPEVDQNKCTNCGLCEKICPIQSKKENPAFQTIAYGAYNKNLETRFKSSSGGIFSVLSEHVLGQGGVVFGAAFNKDFEVEHTYIENVEDLDKLRGSKYVQSKIGNCFAQAKEFLDKGRVVLFSGTPCQIGGLYSFLMKDYPNLITQDLICHGVPSPKLWRKYVEFRKNDAGANIKNLIFRKKLNAWRPNYMFFSFENNTEYCKLYRNDFMIKSFFAHWCLRPICHKCAFKSVSRQADITLADFWGINNVDRSLNDHKGTSLVLLHSEKGKEVFEKIKQDIVFKQVDLDRAIKGNPSIKKSTKPSLHRADFMKRLDSEDFEKLLKRYKHKHF